jgi:hypothetical protein
VAGTHRIDASLGCENDRVPVPVQIQFEIAEGKITFPTFSLCAAAAITTRVYAMHDGMGAKRGAIRSA